MVGEAVIETPRLLLRELTMDDLDFVASMLSHPEVMRFWHKVYSRAEAASWIADQRDRYARHGHGFWLAVDRETGWAVGQAGLLALDIDGSQEVCLGYLTHYPYWRRGFAAEASGACLRHAFETLRAPRVLAPIRPENAPSRALALGLGMEFDGWTTYRVGLEHMVYAVSRAAWLNRRPG